MEDIDRIQELGKQGFFCSQILLLMGLELQGKTNPDLVRSMHGLAGGLGFTGEICGALTGGVCLLGLYAGRGLPEDEEEPRLMFMIEDLTKWFKEGYGKEFGGITCDQLLESHFHNQAGRCPRLVAGTFQEVKELLVANGFDLYGSADES